MIPILRWRQSLRYIDGRAVSNGDVPDDACIIAAGSVGRPRKLEFTYRPIDNQIDPQVLAILLEELDIAIP
jgi:hypothetical protein